MGQVEHTHTLVDVDLIVCLMVCQTHFSMLDLVKFGVSYGVTKFCDLNWITHTGLEFTSPVHGAPRLLSYTSPSPRDL
jgi:hypothetical protein